MTSLQLAIVLVAAIAVSSVAVYIFMRRLILRVVRTVWIAVEKTAAEADKLARPLRPLPISLAIPFKHNEKRTVRAKPVVPGFVPQRVFISGFEVADNVPNGAANWIINDIRVDGSTQYVLGGDIPGDMFATNAIDGFVRFTPCYDLIELDVTFIGTSEKGVPFYASILGVETSDVVGTDKDPRANQIVNNSTVKVLMDGRGRPHQAAGN